MILYALTEPATGIIRYIGKTTISADKRLQQHCDEARRGGRSHKLNWIRSLIRQNQRPCILTLRDDIQVSENLMQEEIDTISFCREIGLPLTNATDGGDGAAGRKTDAETRAKMRASRLGRRASPETIEKIRHAHVGKKRPKETGERISAAKSLPIFCSDGRIFKNISDAAHYLKLSRTAIHNRLLGKTKQTTPCIEYR